MTQRFLVPWNYITFEEDGACKLAFFHTAADELPFHEQWYRKYGDPVKNAYLELPLCFDPSISSMLCYIIMKNAYWLE